VRFMKALFRKKQVENVNEDKRASHKNLYSAETMKRHSTFGAIITLFLFIIISLPISHVQAEMVEQDIGIPWYPGSRQIPSCAPIGTDKNHPSFRNINLITPDSFKKVLFFYQEKIGKFSISKSQASTKSALWNESTPKGYRIITLVETEEGTKITITKRTW
jgi:hypothetical protein